MDRQLDKYPYKKTLYFTWYEAGIANLILFKCTYPDNKRPQIKIHKPYIFPDLIAGDNPKGDNKRLLEKRGGINRQIFQCKDRPVGHNSIIRLL